MYFMREIQLNDGISMPMLGFGTSELPQNEVSSVVRNAIECGYRLIDTAAGYDNEQMVGEGIRQSSIARSELFITTKLKFWWHGYEDAMRECKDSLKRLGLDYVDLYLIHWPVERNDEAWHAMEALQKDGLVRSIGVCNHHTQHLDALFDYGEVRPVINQVEISPRLQQAALREECAKRNIVAQAWSPLMAGEAFAIPQLQTIADKHGITVSQVVLGWLLSNDVSVIARTRNPKHMQENLDAFSYVPDAEDAALIASLETGRRIGPHPDTFPQVVLPHINNLRQKEIETSCE